MRRRKRAVTGTVPPRARRGTGARERSPAAGGRAGAKRTPRKRTTRKRRSRKQRPPAWRPGKRTWIGALAVVLGVAGSFGVQFGWERLADHPALVVREVTVTGAETADPEELLALAAVAEGEPWLRLDGGAAARRVGAHPSVDRVRIRRPGVGRVRIDVRECVPVARIEIAETMYGLTADLRVIPERGERDATLPLLRSGRTPLDPGALERGLAYVQELRRQGLEDGEALVVELAAAGPDRIRLPGRGFAATVEPAVDPREAARNVAGFLETLDSPREARGTLRLISERTAVWSAAA